MFPAFQSPHEFRWLHSSKAFGNDVEVRWSLASASLLVWPSNNGSTLQTFPPLVSFSPNLLQEQRGWLKQQFFGLGGVSLGDLLFPRGHLNGASAHPSGRTGAWQGKGNPALTGRKNGTAGCRER